MNKKDRGSGSENGFWIIVRLLIELIVLIILSSVSCYMQFLQRKSLGKIGDLFSGTLYKYNYFMYFIGFVLFLTLLGLFLVKFFSVEFRKVLKKKLVWKIIFWVLSFIGVLTMFFSLTFLNFAMLGLGGAMNSNFLELVSIIGWSVLTFISMIVDMIIVYKKANVNTYC